jgi:two-component system nitrogen regulation response regulator GlnG
MDGTVLVADDDSTIRTVLTQALTRAGCKVHATSSLTTLMRWVAEGRGDAVITDVVMPDGNGLEMLPKIAMDRPGLPVIVISAQNTIMTAIQAAEAEAFDYLPKPFDLPDLMKRTARALDRNRLRARAEPVVEQPQDLPLVGRTPVMQALYQLVARVMNLDQPILISGESGTGKTLIAKVIHDFSDRRSRPLATISDADMRDPQGPARLLSRTRGGTLVIDEIVDFDIESQARIVRMIDAPGDTPPRIMATCQTDPAAAMEAGHLRRDLFFRLSGTIVQLPPLRDRVDDIALLSGHFLSMAERDGASPRRLARDAADLLRAYSWPGNVRQLENIVRRLCLSGRSDEIGRPEVATVLGSQPAVQPLLAGSASEKLSESVARHLQRYFDLHGALLPPPGLYPRILREIEAPLIGIALDATGGNQAKCADLLGINRNTLRKKMTDLDIQVTRRRKLM